MSPRLVALLNKRVCEMTRIDIAQIEHELNQRATSGRPVGEIPGYNPDSVQESLSILTAPERAQLDSVMAQFPPQEG